MTEMIKITSKMLNKLIVECEPMIKRATVKIPHYMKDEVQQEMRIKIWRLIENKYDGTGDVQDFVVQSIGSVYKSSKNTIGLKFSKNQRFLPLKAAQSVMIKPEVELLRSNKEKKKIFDQLIKCLDEHEKFILQYMIITGNINPNYDMLMRQLGYTGKGSIRYILDGIKTKMTQFAKENDIKVDF